MNFYVQPAGQAAPPTTNMLTTIAQFAVIGLVGYGIYFLVKKEAVR